MHEKRAQALGGDAQNPGAGYAYLRAVKNQPIESISKESLAEEQGRKITQLITATDKVTSATQKIIDLAGGATSRLDVHREDSNQKAEEKSSSVTKKSPSLDNTVSSPTAKEAKTISSKGSSPFYELVTTPYRAAQRTISDYGKKLYEDTKQDIKDNGYVAMAYKVGAVSAQVIGKSAEVVGFATGSIPLVTTGLLLELASKGLVVRSDHSAKQHREQTLKQGDSILDKEENDVTVSWNNDLDEFQRNEMLWIEESFYSSDQEEEAKMSRVLAEGHISDSLKHPMAIQQCNKARDLVSLASQYYAKAIEAHTLQHTEEAKELIKGVNMSSNFAFLFIDNAKQYEESHEYNLKAETAKTAEAAEILRSASHQALYLAEKKTLLIQATSPLPEDENNGISNEKQHVLAECVDKARKSASYFKEAISSLEEAYKAQEVTIVDFWTRLSAQEKEIAIKLSELAEAFLQHKEQVHALKETILKLKEEYDVDRDAGQFVAFQKSQDGVMTSHKITNKDLFLKEDDGSLYKKASLARDDDDATDFLIRKHRDASHEKISPDRDYDVTYLIQEHPDFVRDHEMVPASRSLIFESPVSKEAEHIEEIIPQGHDSEKSRKGSFSGKGGVEQDIVRSTLITNANLLRNQRNLVQTELGWSIDLISSSIISVTSLFPERLFLARYAPIHGENGGYLPINQEEHCRYNNSLTIREGGVISQIPMNDTPSLRALQVIEGDDSISLLLTKTKKIVQALDAAYTLNSLALLKGSVSHWDAIIEKARAVKAAYAAALEKATESAEIFQTVSRENRELKMARNEHSLWNANIAWYEGKKAECIAAAAGVKARTKAQKITAWLPWSEASRLKHEARQKEQEAKPAFLRTVEAFQQGLEGAIGDLKFPWIEQLENLANWNPPNREDRPWYEEQQQILKLSLARSKAEIGVTPNDLKESVTSLKNKAFFAANRATESYRSALDASPEEQNALWIRAFEKAKEVKNAWTTTREALEGVPPHVQEYLKEWFQKELKIAQRYELDWEESLLQFNKDSPGEGPSALRSGDLSKDDLHNFPYASLIKQVLGSNSMLNSVIKSRVLKTLFEYPYVQLKEFIDSDTLKISYRQKMIADHVLVTLKEEEYLENFCEQVRAKSPSLEAVSIERVTPYGSLYQLHFRPTSLGLMEKAMSEVLKATQDLGASGASDQLMLLDGCFDNLPNDELYRRGRRWPQLSWNLRSCSRGGISARKGWNKQTDAPDIIVAVIDSGILETHEDLFENMWGNRGNRLEQDKTQRYGFSVVDGDSSTTDRDGHGTKVAGVIGASGNNGVGIAGVAWDVQLMACKVSSDKYVLTSNMIKGIEGAVHRGATVLNCSFGLLAATIKNKSQFSNLERVINEKESSKERKKNSYLSFRGVRPKSLKRLMKQLN